MIISMIAAADEKGGIGKDNQLPWHIPSDLKRFQQLTMGHCLVMGHKTYLTIGKPLTGRVMIVLTRQADFSLEGCLVAHSLEEAIQLARLHDESELFIIGGGQVFEQAMPVAERIYLTAIHAETDADVFFPSIDMSEWEVITQVKASLSEGESFGTDFKILQRRHKNASSDQFAWAEKD